MPILNFFAPLLKNPNCLLGFPPSPSERHICGGYAFLQNAKIPTAHLVAVGKKASKKCLIQTRSHPRHGDDLGVWGGPQQAIFEIDLQGKFSKIRKLVQVCTACHYYAELNIIVVMPKKVLYRVV
jgi:hypothetical protein